MGMVRYYVVVLVLQWLWDRCCVLLDMRWLQCWISRDIERGTIMVMSQYGRWSFKLLTPSTEYYIYRKCPARGYANHRGRCRVCAALAKCPRGHMHSGVSVVGRAVRST